jgi:hypothetical protein
MLRIRFPRFAINTLYGAVFIFFLVTITLPVVVQAQTTVTEIKAAGPCFNNSDRYVDCGNGTVTDTTTGLIEPIWDLYLPRYNNSSCWLSNTNLLLSAIALHSVVESA